MSFVVYSELHKTAIFHFMNTLACYTLSPLTLNNLEVINEVKKDHINC